MELQQVGVTCPLTVIPAIAKCADPRKIFAHGQSAVLFSNDVIWFDKNYLFY